MHLNHKHHLDVVTKVQNQDCGFLLNFLQETLEDQNSRTEYANHDRPNLEEISILIDNALVIVKFNSSMLSVQDTHDHLAKYFNIPASWRSKNYALEFIGCIHSVVKSEILNKIQVWLQVSMYQCPTLGQ